MDVRNKIINRLTKSTLFRDILSTSILGFLGRISGFLIPVLIARWFGISNETDVFFLAYSIIFYLVLIFSEVLRSIIVPYILEMEAGHKEKISFFLGNIVIFILFFLTIFSGIFIYIAKPVFGIVTGLSAESLQLLTKLIIGIAPLIVIISLTSIITGILNAYRHFWVYAISPAFRTASVIAIICVLKEKIGIYSIVFGYVGGELCNLIALSCLYKIKKMPPIRFSKDHFFDFRFFKFLKDSSYQIVGMTSVGFIPFIDKIYASWLGNGSISILEYSQRLYMVPYLFISSGIMVILLTHWSGLYYKKQFKIFYGSYLKVQKILLLSCIFTVTFFVLFSKVIIKIIYGGSRIGLENVINIASIFCVLILSLVPEILGLAMTRIFILTKHTEVIRDLGILRLVLKLILNFVLIRYFGLLGIVIATFTMYIMSFIFLNLRLKNILNSILNIEKRPVPIYEENCNS